LLTSQTCHRRAGEGSSSDVRRSSIWTTEAAIDAARLKTEAFGAALKEIAKAWTSINAAYNRTTAAALR
jgi:hypothetical protein